MPHNYALKAVVVPDQAIQFLHMKKMQTTKKKGLLTRLAEIMYWQLLCNTENFRSLLYLFVNVLEFRNAVLISHLQLRLGAQKIIGTVNTEER